MSKFDKIFEARETGSLKTEKSRREKSVPNEVRDSNVKDSKVKDAEPDSFAKTDNLNESLQTIERNSIPAQPRRGRPAAKRSNPDFVGLTTYIRRDTHIRAKIALLQEGEGKELSELVEELIYEWLEKK